MGGAAPLAILGGAVVVLLLVDLLVFARGREPSFREGAVWSVGWLLLSLAVAPLLLAVDGGRTALDYTTVYFIERSLSLDNLFVFLLLFAYFSVPQEHRARLLFIGIVMALVLRALAIVGGTALLESFHAIIYPLGLTLLYLAYKIFRGVGEDEDPETTFPVRMARRLRPQATPETICLIAIVFADIAFAIDSIPAAFAITEDAFPILAANAFALLGLRALFVLVEGLIRRFRYLDETIAIVLGIVAVKLLIEDAVKIGPVVSLAIIAIAFTAGIVASVVVDRNDPDSEAKRAARAERTAGSL